MRKLSLLSLLVIGLAGLTGCDKGKTGDTKPAAESTTTTTTTTTTTKDKSGKVVKPSKVKALGSDSAIIPVGKSFAKGGGADALVTIIEFSDFQCPFCSRVNPTMAKIKETYGKKVRVVFKHNPLPFHKDAPLASQASIAAGMQGKFWEMHDILFKNQRALKPDNITSYAKELGLDMTRFNKDLNSAETRGHITADQALGKKVGARGTPNFLINGTQISGARPFDAFQKVIDAELKAVAGLKGVKPDQVYATRVRTNFKKPTPRAKKGGGDNSKTVYKIPMGAKTPTKGGKEPLVSIIEFSDFQCPFCTRVNPTIKKIMETYGDKVQIGFRQNPLPFHKDAPLASEAALAAGAQGKFWEMHDKLFANQKKLKRASLDSYAQELGLDMAKFKADLDGGTFKAQIKQDQKIAAQFGARGTPNFFVNGRQVTGARPFPAFKTIIDEEIKKAEKLLKSGTPKSGIYAALTAKGLTKAAPRAARKPKAKADDKTVYKVPVAANEFAKGPADALVTIVEFSDFQCPFCTRVNPTIKKITETYGKDVRVVFKHNPLPFHKDAPLASEAALAAGAQGKFWEMHDKLFANQKKLKRANIDTYAQELGLDMGKFKTALDSGTGKAVIKSSMALARQIGAGGTPNFFINGRKLVGAQPFPNFKKIIDVELAKAKKLVAAGTPRAGVYAAAIKNGATKPAKAAGKRPPVDDKKVYDVKINPNDPIKGNKNAPITIVEFSDFQCPFCTRVNPTIKKVMETYGNKVRVIFKQNPLSFHKDAPLAAEASLAAGAQGKFWEMHDILFKNQRKLKRENLEAYAQEIGLNVAKFKGELDKGTFKAQVQTDIALARSLGATGTPSFFINGRKLRGAQPFPRFKALIDEELKKKK